jgi:hypothetical protein
MTLSDADVGFLIAMIALNLPAINVGLKDILEREIDISANQVSGVAKEQLGPFTEAIPERLDDQQPQLLKVAGSAPEERADGFDVHGAKLAGGEGLDFAERDVVILKNLLRSRGRLPVKAAAAFGFNVGGEQRKCKLGVFANAAD